jgi:aminomethyltransferase
MSEPATATPLRSPLYDRHVALGAKLADFGGWEMPIEYPGAGGVLKEHEAVRSAAGLFDVSHLGKMRVVGTGAADFVNAQFTNDLRRISAGKAQYSMLCNEFGGVVDDLIVYLMSDDDVFVIPNAANTGEVVRLLTERAPSGIGVANDHFGYGVIAVQGPRSVEVMTDVSLPHDLDYMSFVEHEHDGRPVVICRTGYTGEHGYEILPRWQDTGYLWDQLLAAVDGRGGRVAGLGARDTLRTEMGYPLHGQDISPSISPVEAGSGWAVGWDKPDFAGRVALLDEKARGPARRLRGLRTNDRGIPRPHMQVSTASGRVGEVTSGTFSPSLRVGIGLALLDSAVNEGDVVSVDVRGRPLEVTVVRPPFVDASPR